jgi:hypothetical protein
MTPDQLRQGAALVRCLVEGDETARGPLSDWLEDNGSPWSDDRQPLPVLSWWLWDLRSPVVKGRVAISRPYSDVVKAEYIGGPSGAGIWTIGYFPLWAWEGTYADH